MQEKQLTNTDCHNKEHVCHSYACRNIKFDEEIGKTIIDKVESPRPLISGSLASPFLIAHIAVQKYLNGLLPYRIEKGFCYDGLYSVAVLANLKYYSVVVSNRCNCHSTSCGIIL